MSRLLLTVFLLLASCSSLKVAHDYDRELDYSQYRTYDFFEPMDTRLGPLDTKRALRAVDRILQSRGYVKANNTAKPQFFVNIKSEVIQGAPSGSVGIGMGGTGNQVGAGISVGVPVGEPTLKQIVYLDMVDVAADALFWQARVEAPVRESQTPEQREKRMYAIMEKALAMFPPDGKGRK